MGMLHVEERHTSGEWVYRYENHERKALAIGVASLPLGFLATLGLAFLYPPSSAWVSIVFPLMLVLFALGLGQLVLKSPEVLAKALAARVHGRKVSWERRGEGMLRDHVQVRIARA